MTRTRLVTAGLLTVWAVACTVAGAGLMRSHWVPRPVPPADVPVGAGYSVETGEWVAIHVLSSECGCSRRVLSHLNARGAESGVRERIVWVTEGGEPPAVPAGFEVEGLTPAALAARHGLEAVPVLVVIAPDGAVRYRGGYTDRKQGLAIQDRAILSAVRRGESVPVLPVYGCASGGRVTSATAVRPLAPRREVP